MPRQGPRRPYIGVRLDPEQLEELDRCAAQRGIKRSEMIRIMIDYYIGKRK